MTNAQKFESINAVNFNNLSDAEKLKVAYDVVSGYLSVDKDTFAAALEFLKKDKTDPEFAKLLIKMYEDGTSFKEVPNPDDYTGQIEEYVSFMEDSESKVVEQEVLRDPEVADAMGNTAFVNDADEELSPSQMRAANEVVLGLAKQECAREVPFDDGEGSLQNKYKKALKEHALRILGGLRIHEHAGTPDFDNKDCLNFGKRLRVPARKLTDLFDRKKKEFKDYINKLEQSSSNKTKKVVRRLGYVAMGIFVSISLNVVLTSCSNSAAQNNSNGVPTDTTEVVQAAQQSSSQKQAPLPVTVVKEYSDSLGVSHAAWLSTQNFDNNSFTHELNDTTTIPGYDFAYQRLTDSVMKTYFGDGVTREQVLNTHRYLRSMYPNPGQMENKGINEDVLAAAGLAKAFDQYLNGCSDEIPENIGTIMNIDQVVGNLSVRAVSITNPCDQSKVNYVKTKTRAQKRSTYHKTQTRTTQSVDAVVTVTAEPDTVAPVVKQVEFIDQDPDIVIDVQHPTQEKATKVKLMKGNSTEDGKKKRDASVEEVFGVQSENVTFMSTLEPDTFSNVASTVTAGLYKGNGLVDGQKVKTVTLDEVTNVSSNAKDIFVGTKTDDVSVSDSVPSEAVKTSKVTFVDASSMAPVENKSSNTADASLATSTGEMAAGFVGTASAASKEDVTTEFSETSSRASTQSQILTVSRTDNVEIVVDSLGTKDIPLGTPSAGYVAERGGVGNTGLTAERLKWCKDFWKDKYNEDAYDDILEGFKLQDAWYVKGGIFEGLTPEEALYMTASWVAYSKYAPTPNVILEYTFGCHQGEVVPQDVATKVKSDIDKVRQNKKIEGLPYDKNIRVTGASYDCNKGISHSSHRVKIRSKADLGEKFPRLYRRDVPRDVVFVDAEPQIDITVVRQTQEVAPKAKLMKGNSTEDGKKKRDASIDEVRKTKSRGRNIFMTLFSRNKQQGS